MSGHWPPLWVTGAPGEGQISLLPGSVRSCPRAEPSCAVGTDPPFLQAGHLGQEAQWAGNTAVRLHTETTPSPGPLSSREDRGHGLVLALSPPRALVTYQAHAPRPQGASLVQSPLWGQVRPFALRRSSRSRWGTSHFPSRRGQVVSVTSSWPVLGGGLHTEGQT